MKCEKCRKKAKEIAVEADGVTSMTIQGDNKNEVVVIGDGMDACKLASSLRRKVGITDIVSVEEVKPKEEEPKPKPKPKEEEPKPIFEEYPYQGGLSFVMFHVVPEPSPNGCSIM
eukprot:TRINITY_DN1314_c0_g1_i1.p1 TRINITY_DN1314_c0_g1~~TRINITY_DN1314_c0_g1_i1.p1  ORF type:complete len:115 (+),score=23.62 TRINITY_DN1314_c0_g1_i1:202-546(+)